jgi:hypothetical protein
MYKWYRGAYWSGESTEQLPYTVWAIFSFWCGAATILTEQIVYLLWSVPLVIHSDLELLGKWKYGWSYPIWLAINFVFFFLRGEGAEIVRRMDETSTRSKKAAYATGTITFIGVIVASVLMIGYVPQP